MIRVQNPRKTLDDLKQAQRDGTHLWVAQVVYPVGIEIFSHAIALTIENERALAVQDPYCMLCTEDFSPELLGELCTGNASQPLCEDCGLHHSPADHSDHENA